MSKSRCHGIEIRAVELTPARAAHIASLWRRAWGSARPDVDTLEPLEHWLTRVQAEFVPPHVLLAAQRGGDILAFMVMTPAERHIAQLFVDVPFQAQGLGRLLLDEACRRMPSGWRLQVAAPNHRAQAFYERYGLRRGEADLNPATGRPRIAYTWSPAG